MSDQFKSVTDQVDNQAGNVKKSADGYTKQGGEQVDKYGKDVEGKLPSGAKDTIDKQTGNVKDTVSGYGKTADGKVDEGSKAVNDQVKKTGDGITEKSGLDKVKDKLKKIF